MYHLYTGNIVWRWITTPLGDKVYCLAKRNSSFGIRLHKYVAKLNPAQT